MMNSIEKCVIVSKFFYLWKNNLKTIKKDFKRIISTESFDEYTSYNEFNKLKEEELNEIEYAAAMDMDSIYWCWGCKYGDCRISH